MPVFRSCLKKTYADFWSSHRTKWLLMKCLKLQPTFSCLLIKSQHRHCSREGIRRQSLQLDLEAISESNQGLVPWYTHISHPPHQILYVCVIFGHEKWWKVDETELTPWLVAAGCDIRRAIIKLWIQQSAGNVFISCVTAFYFFLQLQILCRN